MVSLLHKVKSRIAEKVRNYLIRQIFPPPRLHSGSSKELSYRDSEFLGPNGEMMFRFRFYEDGTLQLFTAGSVIFESAKDVVINGKRLHLNDERLRGLSLAEYNPTKEIMETKPVALTGNQELPKLGRGEFVVIVGGELTTYDHWSKIPAEIDEVVKFCPETPHGPHSDEAHREIATMGDKLKEILKRCSSARSSSNLV